MYTATRHRVIAMLAILALGIGSSTRGEATLTGAARLSAIYDAILGARLDQAHELIAIACDPAPREACQALGVAALWWQLVLDPADRSLDARFESAAHEAIDAALAWTVREPARAESWFYLAAATAPLVQWRVLRGDRLAAARDGNRIRNALERALALDPTMHDAKFGIGLYHYYADVASAGAKVLRWLLLLPGGDRAQGLREMLEARDQGELLTREADYQLHWLYLWYERQPDRALALLRRLDRQYPGNPVFLKRIAEVQDEYVHDHPASAASWTDLLNRSQSNQTPVAGLAAVNARLGLGVELDAMFETDRALVQFQSVVDSRPVEPRDGLARAHLLLGTAYDRLGRRSLAVASYQQAVRLATAINATDIRSRARTALGRRPDVTLGDAYRSSLEGLRALESGDRTGAVALLARAVAVTPDDPVALYRYSLALQATGDDRRATATRERVLQAQPAAPAIVLSSAYVDAATISERDGERARAIELYQRAIAVVGGAPAAHETARAALNRLAPKIF
jgi:tetratricopeptide (TPR) repeat protein